MAKLYSSPISTHGKKQLMWTWRQKLAFFGLFEFLKMLMRRIRKGHWSIYTDRIGTSLSEATSDTEITGSPYKPLVNGRLKAVIITVNGSAVTSLYNAGYVVVKSVSFGGVELFIPFSGPGIKTAPGSPGSSGMVMQECDLKVTTGSNLKVFVKHETADTPVTFELQVFGVFQG